MHRIATTSISYEYHEESNLLINQGYSRICNRHQPFYYFRKYFIICLNAGFCIYIFMTLCNMTLYNRTHRFVEYVRQEKP